MTATQSTMSRREFGRIAAAAGAAAVPLPRISRDGSAPDIATQTQAAANNPTLADLKPHPALTPEQAGKLDEALTRLAGQLSQLRKHTLPYSAEPAFVFRAELPRRPAAAAAPAKG